MVDLNIGSGNNPVVQNLLQSIENNKAQQSATQSADDSDRDALQQRLAKQAMLKQQQSKDHISHDHAHQLLRKEAIDKRLGPGVGEWAGAEALQKKLTAKQKQLFINQAQQGDPKANAAGSALAKMSGSPHFGRAVPTAQAAGDLQAAVLGKPASASSLQKAIDSRFMGDKGGDAAAKQGFLRFAARHGDTRGITIGLGGDMLGALSGGQVPGFAQRAALKMMDRNPDNATGAKNLQDFVEQPQLRAMPSMARGRATEVLAKGDGTQTVREGLEEVAGSPGFEALPRGDKARLFATIGQGRASELRAITDQTLIALKTANFPTQSQQVSRFLGGLGRQIDKGKGSAKDIDPKALLRQAKRSAMPGMPKLVSTVDSDDEDAQAQARSHNRAALMRYYSQVSEHYDGIEGQIKNAKYFEDINLLTSLKPARMPETEGVLQVSAQAKQEFTGEMDKLNEGLRSKDLTRPKYMTQVRALQTRALGRADLSADDKTWVGVITADALNTQTFTDLAGKKNRKLREVGKSLMPPAKRRRLGQERRTVTAQPRYFRPDDVAAGKGQVARTVGMPLPPGQAGSAQGTGQGLNPQVEGQLRQLISGLQQLLQGSGTGDLGQKLERLTLGLGQAGGAGRAAPAAAAKAGDVPATKPATLGRTDGWGIPRTFERDLGATANSTPVRAAKAAPTAEAELPKTEGAAVPVVRATAQLRDLQLLYGLPWKALSRDESNVFRNLGWGHATWDAKGQPGARMPVSFATPYAELSPKERSSVQALGFTQEDWDGYVAGIRGR